MTWFDDQMDADAIMIGAELAGLAAAAELAQAGRRALQLPLVGWAEQGGCLFSGRQAGRAVADATGA